MKANTRLILAVAALVLATSAASQEAEKPVAVNTEGLPEHLRARIEEKAQRGIGELRRYLESTRHIYNLRIEALVKPEEPAGVAGSQRELRKAAHRNEPAN